MILQVLMKVYVESLTANPNVIPDVELVDLATRQQRLPHNG